ncbi:MAG TPA: hypothetical protein VNX88_02750 [Terriglobales bacterium]|nr:hypothetical protein [Terriglobales bacterium]
MAVAAGGGVGGNGGSASLWPPVSAVMEEAVADSLAIALAFSFEKSTTTLKCS